MDDARNPLKATMLEAEAVWGVSLKVLMEPVFKLEREFVIYVQLHLAATNPAYKNMAGMTRETLLKPRRDVLYDLDSADDEYWKEMLQALAKVDDHLRARLIPK